MDGTADLAAKGLSLSRKA